MSLPNLFSGHGHHSSNWGCHGDDWTWLKAVVEDDLMQDLLLFQLALQPSPCLSPVLRGVDEAFVKGKSVNTGHSFCTVSVCVCQNLSMTNTHSDSSYLSVHFDFPCFLHISWWIVLLGHSHICNIFALLAEQHANLSVVKLYLNVLNFHDS